MHDGVHRTDTQKQYKNSNDAERCYGKKVARKYIQRINIIKSARDISELCSLPDLTCHSLKGDRKGQWAIKLTGFYRLLFTLKGDLLEIACIEDVSKHYDD
ncbi:type II toxin-antitoxin system RelE/ParE family toxin [candidate division KSB1 bacterium]|nr:type II toxin-antitoxin system RelE/ParE family toxin [candidate division KSB1 bacterium]